MCFNILFKFAFLFIMLFSILSILCFGIVLCFVPVAVSFPILYKFTEHCHLVGTQLQSVTILSYIALQPHLRSLSPCISLESHHLITFCVPVCSKFNNFRTPKAMELKQKERLTTRSLSIS